MNDKRPDRSDAFALEAHMLKPVRPEDMAALLEKAAAKRQELEQQALTPAPDCTRPETKAAQFRTSRKTASQASKVLHEPAAPKRRTPRA